VRDEESREGEGDGDRKESADAGAKAGKAGDFPVDGFGGRCGVGGGGYFGEDGGDHRDACGAAEGEEEAEEDEVGVDF